MVEVEWKREVNMLTLKATVPAIARAKISIPKAGLHDVTIEESGKPVWQKGPTTTAFLASPPGPKSPTM